MQFATLGHYSLYQLHKEINKEIEEVGIQNKYALKKYMHLFNLTQWIIAELRVRLS